MSWNVVFEYFEISETRAVRRDTDYLAANVSVNGLTQGAQVTRVGNLDNGDFYINMVFPIDVINPDDQIVFCYLITNHGGDKTATIETDCVNAVSETSLIEFDPVGATPVGASITCMFPLDRSKDFLELKWLTIKTFFTDLHNDHCDGPVVIDSFSFFGRDTALAVGQRTFSYAGLDSAVGCGKNSRYRVIWSFSEAIPPPPIQ